MKKLFLVALAYSVVSFAEEAAKPAPLWDSNAEASVLKTSGNTDVTTIGLNAASTYSPDPWALKGKAGFLTSSTSGTKTAESYEAALRGERKISEPLSVFLSGNYLKNEFTGFADRLGAEAGLSYLLLSREEHSLSSELGVGLLKENLVTGLGGASLGSRSFANARLGAEYKWKFSPTAEFTNTISLLENLSTTADWRLSNTAAVTAIMTELLSLKVSFRVDHLNQPVTGKKSTDTATTVALVAKF